MKNYSSKLLITTLFLTMWTSVVCGQGGPGQPQIDRTTFTLSRRITLEKESEKLEILLPISGSIVNFTIKIWSEIFDGELTIEIYDPSGEKQGNYAIDNQISLKPKKSEKKDVSGSKEVVSGTITKSVEYPKNGNWKVLIIPKNATGTIEIKSEQNKR